MRISTDGFIDLRATKVRTPGDHMHDHDLDPVPEAEAVAFLLGRPVLAR